MNALSALPRAAAACIIAVATGSAPSVSPPAAANERSLVRSSMTRPASGAAAPSRSTRRRSTYQSACWPEESVTAPWMTPFFLIWSSRSARSLTATSLAAAAVRLADWLAPGGPSGRGLTRRARHLTRAVALDGAALLT